MGYEDNPYIDEEGEALMDYDDMPSDREPSPEPRHGMDNMEDDVDDWDTRDRSQTPVYDTDKVKPRKRLVKKGAAAGKESTVVPELVDEDDEDFGREAFLSDIKKSNRGKEGGGSGKKEKKQKWEKKYPCRGAGGEKKSAEIEELWDSIAHNPENDEEGVRTVDDDNFIDDSGLDPSERYGSDNEARSPSHAPQAEEGEEDEEINQLFKVGKKRKKNDKSPAEIALLVENVMAELEVTAEEDADLNRQGKPAVNKLKKLPLLTEVLSKKQLQPEFLDHGVLTLLKNWLEPLPDGSLPNINIRAAILKILTDFPIDLDQYDRREQLKKSGLGKVIMFLSKSDEETTANRRLAKDLVDKWSRPIFNKSTRFEDMRNVDDDRIPFRRPSVKKPTNKASAMESRDGDFDLDISRERKAGQSSGQQASRSESSSRQHATRPEATPMDFVVRPQSKIDPEEVRARAKQIVQDQRRLKDSHDGICCPLNISSPETVAFLSKVAASSDPDQLEEATRNKTLAEVKFKDSNFKSALKHVKKAHRISPNMGGLSSMLTAFKILYVASKAAVGTACDWYKILQVEPFSHINTIKKQYKKLALVLHPDKNPHLGCEEAFKLVGEGFGVLSDRIKRKEYDMILRIRMQEERVNEVETTVVETFWTACSRCRLLHQFDKKYLGHNLVCPSCKRSFQAVEVESANGGDQNQKGSGHRERSKRLKRKVDGGEWFWNASLGNKVVREGLEGEDNGVGGSCEDKNQGSGKEFGGAGGQWAGGRLRSGGLRRRMSTVGEVLARSEEKRVEVKDVVDRLKKSEKTGEEMITLAGMQREMKRKLNKAKLKLKQKERETGEGQKEERHRQEILESRHSVIEEEYTLKNRISEVERQEVPNKSRNAAIKSREALKKIVDSEIETRGALKSSAKSEVIKRGASGKKTGSGIVNSHNSGDGNFEILVEDSDFYDFDKDRVERSFNKGQVWAVYDDHDGMPRNYCLIDEIVSLNPFEVKISWLDILNHGDESLICLEKMGFHISCGRFKVAKKASLNSLNIFSHVMACERAAREVYRIYPKKGSVWALYNEAALGAGGKSLSDRERRHYAIVVCLTSYSDIHGLSLAYLEKVDGFRTVFKRQEVGSHAIRWFQKDYIQLLSHHIPSKKLSGDQVPEFLKDCWELDPASLPSDLRTIDWER